MNTKYYKKYIEKLITKDSTDIIIKREVEADDGYGGKSSSEDTLPPQTVTFYKKRAQRAVVSDSGQTVGYMASNIEKILATFETDIQEGDTFLHNGRHYRAIFVQGFLDVCKQVEVEVT